MIKRNRRPCNYKINCCSLLVHIIYSLTTYASGFCALFFIYRVWVTDTTHLLPLYVPYTKAF